MTAQGLNRLNNIFAALRRHYILIIISILPLLMFHWMLPFITDVTPGHTFAHYLMLVQTEYMFALRTGTFPLSIVWNDIQSSLPSGFGGIYHPVTHIIALLPGYCAGMVMEWNVLMRLLTVLLTHIVLYKFLRVIKADVVLAFFLSTTTVYSLRILFSFYYGVGLEAWTGHLLLCAAIGFYCLKPSRVKGPLSIIGATYWLVCSGHPEEMYFGVLVAGIFTLLIPFFLNAILPGRKTNWQTAVRFWLFIFMFFLSGILLGAAYLLPLYFEAKATMISRQSYSDACLLTDTLAGFIGNFVSPIRASFVAGFGSTQLLLVVAFTPLLIFFRTKIPNVVWAIFGLILLICLFMLGDKTPVHYYLLEYFPFASSIRAPGRIALMLPVLFMLILYWLFRKDLTAFNIKIKAITITTLPALLVLLVYIFAIPWPLKDNLFSFSHANLSIIPLWVNPLSFLLGIIMLIAAAVYGLMMDKKAAYSLGALLCLAACLQLVLTIRYAPLPRQTIIQKNIRSFDQYLAQKQATLDVFNGYLFPFDNNSYPYYIKKQKENYFIEHHLGQIYRNYINADNLDQAYLLLNSKREQNEVVVENYRGSLEINGLPLECENVTDRVALTYSSYNRMVFKAQACRPSFFVFSYNRTGHWQAWVNGEKTKSYRANGHAHAVPVPAGASTIEFRYWSWAAFWGMLISCISLSAIGAIYGLRGARKPAGYFIVLVAVIGAGSLFLVWYNSLYTGENLHTGYTWQSPPPDTPQNLAFGKPTQMSMRPYGDVSLNLLHNSRNGVDGGRFFSSSFATDYQFAPWWEVDLLRSETIGSIIIHTSLQGKENNKILFYSLDSLKVSDDYGFFLLEEQPVNFNQLPLTLAISVDGKNWESSQITEFRKDQPLIIKPEQPVTARYIRIIASGECRLCLNEVEVYPPAPDQITTNNRKDE